MRTIAIALALLLAVAACKSTGKRTPEQDRYCNDPAKPHAYAFDSQDDAEAAGCELHRIHRQVERDGKRFDDEAIVFCCPRR